MIPLVDNLKELKEINPNGNMETCNRDSTLEFSIQYPYTAPARIFDLPIEETTIRIQSKYTWIGLDFISLVLDKVITIFEIFGCDF